MFTRLLVLLAVVLIASTFPDFCTTAYGQRSGNPQAASNKPQAAGPADRLSPTIIEVEQAGLSLRLPAGAQITRSGDGRGGLLVEAADMAWIATVEIVQTLDETIDLTASADRAIEESREVARRLTVRTRETIEVAGEKAEHFLLDMELARGVLETRIYSIFNPRPGQFVVYAVRGDAGRDEEFIPLHRAVVETFRFRDPEEVARSIERGLAATQEAMQGLTEADYHRRIVPERWYRIYQRTDGGVREIAYHLIEEAIGRRGDVAVPGRDDSRLGRVEREEGLIVRQQARLVHPDETAPDAMVFEVESTAWMSFDRQREMWSIRQVGYQRLPRGRGESPGWERIHTSTITGTRGEGRIDVAVRVEGGDSRSPTFLTPPIGYVSQAEQHLLYRLLNPGREGEYYMYLFLPHSGDVKRRHEVIRATDNPERFTVESRPDPQSPPSTRTITARGEIVRMVSPEGQITEPSSLEEIHRLWRAAGLPTGEIRATEGTRR